MLFVVFAFLLSFFSLFFRCFFIGNPIVTFFFFLLLVFNSAKITRYFCFAAGRGRNHCGLLARTESLRFVADRKLLFVGGLLGSRRCDKCLVVGCS
jgi:hypothetical protein